MYGLWEKMINLDAVGWASWVQAIGSVIAILASGFIASWQARNQFASALRLQKYNEFKNNTINLVAINASMTHLNGIFGELLADIREQIKPTKGKSKLKKGTYKIAKRPYYKNELETAYSDISKIMIQEFQSADLINSYIKIRSRIWQFLNLSAIQIGEVQRVDNL